MRKGWPCSRRSCLTRLGSYISLPPLPATRKHFRRDYVFFITTRPYFRRIFFMLSGYIDSAEGEGVTGGLGSDERLDFRLETMEPGRTLLCDRARHFVIGRPFRSVDRRPHNRHLTARALPIAGVPNKGWVPTMMVQGTCHAPPARPCRS